MPLYSTPPSLADCEEIARRAYAELPATFTRFVGDVVIRVVDFPDEETEREMALETPFDLLGLYRGVDMGSKSVTATAQDVDMIFLYRRPLLDFWCDTNEDLEHLIRHVLIHEIGHHFGLSDEDMEALEEEAEAEEAKKLRS